MKKFIESLEKKIRESVDVNKIEIIDNTYKHLNHKHHSGGKFHIKIIIESNFLKSMTKIESQKRIMDILENELKDKIHSLEIKIN